MKRIIALLLVLVTALCLVGCNEDLLEQIKNHKDQYDYVPTIIEDMTFDMYIICDTATQSAKDAVTRQINLYTEAKFKTKLVIHYLSAAEYESAVMDNLDTADLILVTGETMARELVENDKLVDLSFAYASDDYGRLNVDIADALLEASKLPVPSEDEAQQETLSYFVVPNNRVVGTYSYVCINKQTVHRELMYPLNAVESLPYVFSLDQANSESGIARLTRSIMLRSLLAAKDPTAVAQWQADLFDSLVVDAFYDNYKFEEQMKPTCQKVKNLLSLLTEEQLEVVSSDFHNTYEQDYRDFMAKCETHQYSSDPEDEEKNNDMTMLRRIFNTAKSEYSKAHFHYGTGEPADPSDPPLLPYPSAADLVALAMEVQESVDDVKTAWEEVGILEETEIEDLWNYKTSSVYEEMAKPAGGAVDLSSSTSDVVFLTGAMYEDKAAIEAQGWICNVIEVPTITSAEALESSFAVVKHENDSATYADRVMQIIYAFNTDTYLHNLLLYGVEDMNYTLHEGEVTLTGDDYRMSYLYTGNMFISYYCDELGYTKTVAENGALQNKDAVVYVAPVEPDEPDEPDEPGADE